MSIRCPSDASQRLGHRRLDFAVGDMERADRVPHPGMRLEPFVRRARPVGAHRREPRLVGHRPMVARIPLVERRHHRPHLVRPAQRDEHPAAFLAPLGEPRVAQDLDVPAHARLALAQHLRELAHAQLHRAEQREDAQPRRIRQRAEDGEGLVHAG